MANNSTSFSEFEQIPSFILSFRAEQMSTKVKNFVYVEPMAYDITSIHAALKKIRKILNRV